MIEIFIIFLLVVFSPIILPFIIIALALGIAISPFLFIIYFAITTSNYLLLILLITIPLIITFINRCIPANTIK